ncbi:hypothetical protein SAMN05421797_10518 [Maribacter ulvicola]|uniref:Uncharacterized protein n=1 Tax=Maribacter ulvicola TaxID=228959 RepID=A0A1N6X7F6_9FLAO|nr:hypothetical protein SAMN05421797_10518 [Maribacter ulvicola]
MGKCQNLNAEKGKGGISNKAGKDAYILIPPYSRQIIFDLKGSGIITKI